MSADPILRARRAADSLLGGPGVREFAACEFPREDPAWVAAQTRASHRSKVGNRSGWKWFRRGWGRSGERAREAPRDPTAG